MVPTEIPTEHSRAPMVPTEILMEHSRVETPTEPDRIPTLQLMGHL